MSAVPVLGRAVQAPIARGAKISAACRRHPCRAEADDSGEHERQQGDEDQAHG